MNYTVNWAAQWESFAKNFYDGKAHINLSHLGSDTTLLLLPGPGFGDLSHPTTSLMLQLMAGKIKNKSILDIGCGSGILALASLLLGAKSASGIDIDPEAIIHARNNQMLNKLKADFSLTPSQKKYDIALMNMIYPEQQEVMKQPLKADLWITSGILVEQRKFYLELTKSWGRTFVEERQEGEWLGFIHQH